MSRWLSPEKAARLAERAAEQDRQRRVEKRKTTLLLIGLALLVLVTFAAWVFVQARLRHSRHHHHERKPATTGGTNRFGSRGSVGTRALARVECEPHVKIVKQFEKPTN